MGRCLFAMMFGPGARLQPIVKLEPPLHVLANLDLEISRHPSLVEIMYLKSKGKSRNYNHKM